MRIRHTCTVAALLLLGTGDIAWAQGPGGSAPTLELESVTVIGKGTVVLPKARKGEVLDTSVYVLPPGDSLLFSDRISNVAGPGGTLPRYREQEAPLKLDAEASIGSYVSPRVSIHGEFIRRTYDIAAFADVHHTEGHTDGARATMFLLGAGGSLAVGDDSSPLGRFRLSAGFEYGADEYSLYGLRPVVVDRSRTTSQFRFGLRDEGMARVRYGLALGLQTSGITDAALGSDSEVTAVTPSMALDLGADLDSLLAARLRLAFESTSLRYVTPTPTPAYVSATAEVEWHAASSTWLTFGLIAASGQSSDSGSQSLIMPRLAVRHELGKSLTLFGWFAPELRAASYKSRILRAPYAESQMTLRPERVPVSATIGVRTELPPFTLEARTFLEQNETTPVVVADPVTKVQSWQHVNSVTMGVTVSAQSELSDQLALEADGTFRRASAEGADDQLPMTPAADVRARLTFVPDPIARALKLHGSVLLQTSQNAVLFPVTGGTTEPTEIPARLLIGAGASYMAWTNLQAFAEVSNLVGYSHDLWLGYSAPGFEIRAGIRVTL